MNINRPSWNKYFMEIATLASSRSSCNRLHVGCVIVKDNQIQDFEKVYWEPSQNNHF